MIELRPYQKNAIKEIWASLKLSDNPALVDCSVGGGKSYLIVTGKQTEEKMKIN